jgi:hypothetical protein
MKGLGYDSRCAAEFRTGYLPSIKYGSYIQTKPFCEVLLLVSLFAVTCRLCLVVYHRHLQTSRSVEARRARKPTGNNNEGLLTADRK